MIDPRYLSDPDGLADLIDAMRHAQMVTQSPSLAPYTDVVHPGIGASDGNFANAIRETMFTTFHLVGTARMVDPADPNAVVDPGERAAELIRNN